MFVEAQEETCEDGTADAMPGARDGARQYGERLSSEEIACQYGGQTSVLHTNFDRDGTLLGLVEARNLSCQIAQHVTQGVVAEHNGEGP